MAKLKWIRCKNIGGCKVFKCRITKHIQIIVYEYSYCVECYLDLNKQQVAFTSMDCPKGKLNKPAIEEWAEQFLRDSYDCIGDALEHWGGNEK